MITVHLYNISDAPERFPKTLGDAVTVNGCFLESMDILYPTLALQTQERNFNYAYIPELSRFYFVRNIVIEDNNFIRVSLSVDVLQSHTDAILKAVATRTESETSKYLNTEQSIHDSRVNMLQVNFPNGFNDDGQIIMVTIKGD